MAYNDTIDAIEAEDRLRQQEELDMERALQLSLQESKEQRAGGSSKSHLLIGRPASEGKDLLQSVDEEIEEVQAQMNNLKSLMDTLLQQREEILQHIRSTQAGPKRNEKGKDKAGDINYNSSEFEWSGALAARLRSVFGFESFRLCQEGICNANMDGRDIVAIMPTGGGKSLGYQLPALMTPGCTIVISPLLALISDQIMHLHEAGVDAVMLTGSISREENDLVFKRLQAMVSDANAPDIKLCYVTPEKIASSKKFKSALDKLYRVGKLARFVVDEAHCVSSQGHDFRPDYQKLGALRQMFPRVAILALSATCPAAVLIDLLNTLRMPGVTMASAATSDGTVLFSTSLYRKNLHYSVLPKPSGTNESITAMRDYILTQHKNDTGIVYCLTKKDAESVAEALRDSSAGAIRTGVYHADVLETCKQSLHKQWREGKIKVVCATIAFGLGIDKGDVRFVIHHSLSKSLDGFYQESGRAGRDGKDADCILFYRPQDAFRIASLACGERGGDGKVIAMIAFASDLEQCRKIAFANYFNKSSKLSISSWTTEQEDALTPCGHCDNCKRPPEALDGSRTRVRVVAWQILRVVQAAGRDVTMAQLCDLARGLGGSKESTSTGGGRKGKGRAKEKVAVDVNKVAGGKVEFSREQTEAVCVRLLVERYLTLSFQQTAYTVNVYLRQSELTGRFTRFSREEIEQGKGPAFECVFLAKTPAKRNTVRGTQSQSGSTTTAKASVAREKRKREPSLSPAEEDEEERFDSDIEEYESSEDDEWHASLRGSTSTSTGRRPPPQVQPQSSKRPRNTAASRTPATSSSSRARTPPDDVIVIDSD